MDVMEGSLDGIGEVSSKKKERIVTAKEKLKVCRKGLDGVPIYLNHPNSMKSRYWRIVYYSKQVNPEYWSRCPDVEYYCVRMGQGILCLSHSEYASRVRKELRLYVVNPIKICKGFRFSTIIHHLTKYRGYTEYGVRPSDPNSKGFFYKPRSSSSVNLKNHLVRKKISMEKRDDRVKNLYIKSSDVSKPRNENYTLDKYFGVISK